jgi:predicted DCC family thiol-disulfide oxidoreductase YuxK
VEAPAEAGYSRFVHTDLGSGKTLVLYDGVCAMCNGFVRFVLKHDPASRFIFAPLQSDVARDTLQRHGHEAHDLDTMYLISDFRTSQERVFSRSAAVLETFRRIGGAWGLLAMLRYTPAALRDLVYALIVRNRYRIFGKYDSCPLPPPEWQGRFVDQ